jgi:hypothetical protein
MTSQEDQQARPPSFSGPRTVAIVTLCLCIGAAAIHVNLLPTKVETYDDPARDALVGYCGLGWPFWYGVGESQGPPGWSASFSGWVKRPDGSWTNPGWITRRPPPTPHFRSELTPAGVYFLLVNLFIACILVASPAVLGRAHRLGQVGLGQFTLSDLFSVTTAVAIVLGLFAAERRYGLAETNGPVPGIYSALSARPLFDRVAISIGIVCTLYVATAAMCQVFRSVVVGLRRLGKNKL